MPSDSGPLSPIFLSSPGRSGSTLVMKVLSLHPRILVRRFFPYEGRVAQYFYLCHILERPHAPFKPIEFSGGPYRPYHPMDKPSMDWYQRQANATLGPDGTDLTTSYYRFVARDEDKEEADHFAEKSIGFAILPQLAARFERTQVVFLKRDPRDTFLSYKTFDLRKGQRHFGEEEGDKATYRRLMGYHRAAKNFARTLGCRGVEVRYEELIQCPTAALSRLFSALGLELEDGALRRLVAEAFVEDEEVKQHRTTPDNRASLHRWKTEADRRARALFDEHRDVLEMLDYE